MKPRKQKQIPKLKEPVKPVNTFTFKKQDIPILKVQIEIASSKNISNIGEVLYDLTQILL